MKSVNTRHPDKVFIDDAEPWMKGAGVVLAFIPLAEMDREQAASDLRWQKE